MSNENMYFDPAAFDFTQLVDVVEGNEAPTIAKTESLKDIGPNGGVTDDASDLADLFTADPDDEAPEGEKDINADVSDLITPEPTEDTIKIFNDLPDDVPLSFGDHEMTKAEAKQFFADKKTFDDQKELISTAANSIDQIHTHIMRNHTSHALTIDTNIANIQRKMNSNISAAEYGEEARKLQQAYEAKAFLNQRTDEELKLLEIEKAEVTRFKIMQTDHAMRSEFPQWDQIKGGLLRDIKERGGDQLLNDLEKVWNPEIAKMLLESYRFRQRNKQAGEKALEAAKAKAPRSTSTAANAQRQKALDETAAKKAALLKKAKTGNLTPEDNAKMFDFLVD
ncbi:hypothetical protein DRT11_23910 [Salmonella enterica subsp. enterica]|nr:hypothetical protein [Salmonella enterica subsp. enterica serovar Bareilly]